MAVTHEEDMFAAVGGVEVTPSDTAQLEPQSRSLWVGTAGTLVVVMADDNELTFANATGLMPLQCKQVKSTGTTASDIISLH